MRKNSLKIFFIAALLVVLQTGQTMATNLSLSVKGGYFHYAEPDAGISYTGLVAGIQGEYQKTFPSFAFRLRSELMSSNLSYDGRLNTHQVVAGSVQVSESEGGSIGYDTNLWYSDSAALIGKVYTKGDYSFSPFAGLGFRYLNNPENAAVPYDYSRRITYVYLPLVLDVRKTISPAQVWGVSGEVDILLKGRACADLSDASENYNDLAFHQSLGGAVKLSGFYNRKLLGMNVSIKPFVDVWLVDESSTDELTYNGTRVMVRSADGGYGDYREPANITMTAGLQLNVLF